MKNAILQKLVSLGGNEWQGGAHHRVYFNNWEEFAGFSVNRYKSGSISSAYLNGEKVSNNQASKMSGKLYYDVNSGTFHHDCDNDEAVLIAIENIKSELNEESEQANEPVETEQIEKSEPVLQYQLANGNWIDCEERTDAFLALCLQYDRHCETMDDVYRALESGKKVRNDSADWYSNCRYKPAPAPVINSQQAKQKIYHCACGNSGVAGRYPFSTLAGGSVCDDCL